MYFLDLIKLLGTLMWFTLSGTSYSIE